MTLHSEATQQHEFMLRPRDDTVKQKVLRASISDYHFTAMTQTPIDTPQGGSWNDT